MERSNFCHISVTVLPDIRSCCDIPIRLTEDSFVCFFRELKDNLGNDEPEGDMPILLQTLLSMNPRIFRDKSMLTHYEVLGGKEGDSEDTCLLEMYIFLNCFMELCKMNICYLSS